MKKVLEKKSSGVDWIGDIPADWTLMRIKEISKMGSGTTPKSNNPHYYDNGEHPWLNTSDVQNRIINAPQFYITEQALHDYPVLKYYPADTVLLAMYGGGTIGNVGLLTFAATINQACCAMVPNKKIVLPKYLYYFLQKHRCKIISWGFGGSQVNLSQSLIGQIPVALPPLPVQKQIVEYLDKKLAAIDNRTEILDKEKRAYARLKKSVINQAVTRGLNPDVKLKDSGIDWIGMIPAHWEIKRFKDVFRNYSTGLTPESKVEENFSDDNNFTWITIGDMVSRVINESAMCLSEKVVMAKKPVVSPKGSLLFSFKLSIGKTAFAGKDLYTNEAIVTIPPTKYAELSYFYYTLPSVCINNATENIYGAKMLNQKIIANMLMVYPPLSEQKAIADYLDEKCAKIDAAIENIEKQIKASGRLKKAIINEAISGGAI